MSLKTVIVGCGKIADGHVEEIAKLKNATVTAVCDVEPLMAEQLALRYRIPQHYSDFGKMLETEHPDVVHVTTPPASHLTLATKAIEAGCHVLVEKPLGIDHRETTQLVEFAERMEKKLTVGYSYVFDPPAIALRDLVRRNVIGEPVHVESYYGYDLDGMFGKATMENDGHWIHKLPGRLIQNNLDHALNKITEFVRDDTPTVHAVGFKRRTKTFGDARDEFSDELRTMIIGNATSAYATFSSHGKPAPHFLRLYGTRHLAHVDYISRTITIDGGTSLPSSLGRLTPAFSKSWQYFREGCKNVFRFARSDFHYFAGLNKLIELFYGSIIDDGAPPIPYADILRVSWLMDRVIEQAALVRTDILE